MFSNHELLLPDTHLFIFSKTIFENLILDIYICPFFKILETFINWNEKQGMRKKVTFLHDGLKNIGSHSFCEHPFFSWFPDNLPLCQYFPLLEAFLGYAFKWIGIKCGHISRNGNNVVPQNPLKLLLRIMWLSYK